MSAPQRPTTVALTSRFAEVSAQETALDARITALLGSDGYDPTADLEKLKFARNQRKQISRELDNARQPRAVRRQSLPTYHGSSSGFSRAQPGHSQRGYVSPFAPVREVSEERPGPSTAIVRSRSRNRLPTPRQRRKSLSDASSTSSTSSYGLTRLFI